MTLTQQGREKTQVNIEQSTPVSGLIFLVPEILRVSTLTGAPDVQEGRLSTPPVQSFPVRKVLSLETDGASGGSRAPCSPTLASVEYGAREHRLRMLC